MHHLPVLYIFFNSKTWNKNRNFSWGSGANPWGDERDDKFSKPNHWDGMLEVVGVTGVVHLGQIQSGLRSAIRIVQVSQTLFPLILRLLIFKSIESSSIFCFNSCQDTEIIEVWERHLGHIKKFGQPYFNLLTICW